MKRDPHDPWSPPAAGSSALDAEGGEALVAWACTRVAAAGADATPPPGPRRRLLESVAGVERFRPFFARLAAVVGLDEASLRAVLALVDEPTGWTVVPGVAFRDFKPGPGSLASEAGL